ncbi:MAG: hypothetical protein ACOYBM_03895 [Dethiobacteria bacterium]|nr:hypothetical protein [Bacillota bacterium]
MTYDNNLFLLIRAIPEAIGTVCLALVLIKKPAPLKAIFLTGTIAGIIIFLIRILPFKFGVHLPIFLIILILMLNYSFKINNLLRNSAGALGAIICLTIFEWLTVPLLSYLFNISLENLKDAGDLIIFAFGLPSLFLLLLVAFGGYLLLLRKENKDHALDQ